MFSQMSGALHRTPEPEPWNPNPAPKKRLRLPSPPCDRDGLTCSPLHETQWPSSSALVTSQREASNTNSEPVMPLGPSSVSFNQDTHSQGQYSPPSCSRLATAAHDTEDGVTQSPEGPLAEGCCA
ncbi:uncharacterized protein LOC135378619 [Ornithodoros turicata]|uniref:uncharacterized protein LOC135378619 n=1 Tax=Ornithodoros turicata TaxID=34597 RepID=UPI003139D564